MSWRVTNTVDDLFSRLHFYVCLFFSSRCTQSDVPTLEKAAQVLSCLQCRLIDLVKRGWHFPLLNVLTFKIVLLSKTLLSTIMSPRFLFLMKFLSTLVQFIKYANFWVLLYVTVSRNRWPLDVLILFSYSFLRIVTAWLIGVAAPE